LPLALLVTIDMTIDAEAGMRTIKLRSSRPNA
jgi:hypothetical protein